MKSFVISACALLYVINAGAMLIAPEGWYQRVPGVTASGPLNTHFVRDIGFVYLLSGLALLTAIRHDAGAIRWIAIGTAWPALHALFHLGEWLHHGLPAAAILYAEILGVVAPVVASIIIAVALRLQPDQKQKVNTHV